MKTQKKFHSPSAPQVSFYSSLLELGHVHEAPNAWWFAETKPPQASRRHPEIQAQQIAWRRTLRWMSRASLFLFLISWLLSGGFAQAATEVSTSVSTLPTQHSISSSRHWILEGEALVYTTSSLGGPMIGSVVSYETENATTVGFRPMLSTSSNQNFSFGAFYRKGILRNTQDLFIEASADTHYLQSREAIYGGIGLSAGTRFYPITPRLPFRASLGLERALDQWIPKLALSFGSHF